MSFLTRDHGKVRAVAKGVRKTKSRFGGRLEPPGHVELLLYEGRGELDIVSQAETIDHFRPLRTSPAGPAVSMLEAADQLALERQQPPMYRMLVEALLHAVRPGRSARRAGFFLKALALEGFRPQVDVCVACGSEGRWCHGRWRRAGCAARPTARARR